jgi:cardiolipin synthase
MELKTEEKRETDGGREREPAHGKKARGVPGIGARLRRLVWSWWIWVLAAAAAATWKNWTAVAILLVVAFLAFLFAPDDTEPVYGLDHDFAVDSEEFLPTMMGATDTPVSSGNQITILNNGVEFYPAMLADIQAAQRTITMEAYIYWEGEVGKQFADALAAKARSGVKVKLLLDAVGSSTISDPILETLRSGGCEIAWYHPVKWYTLKRANNRTHRKTLVVDGKIGYTGGAGIADHWLGNAEDPDHWRDMQIRVQGPSVITLQSGFAHNWLETTGELVSGAEYYPPADTSGPYRVQSILSSPESGASSVSILYYLSIVCARKSIYIANPYFVPNDAAIETLVEAKRRGVDVKIVVSGEHNDNALAYYNSTAVYGPLLEAGVEIYAYNKTMLHHKIMVVDGLWSTVGTTNFDNRSFALNDENNVCVYDRAFAAELSEDFLADLAVADRITLEAWRDRGIYAKVMELLSSTLREQV